MDTGEDLVSDGVSPSGDFVRGDGGAVLLADEHDLVPFDSVDARDIHHAHIHRDAARNRSAPAAHEHSAVIREPAIISVVIAYRKDADPAIRRRAEGKVVANRGARRHVFTCASRHFHESTGWRSSASAPPLVSLDGQMP